MLEWILIYVILACSFSLATTLTLWPNFKLIVNTLEKEELIEIGQISNGIPSFLFTFCMCTFSFPVLIIGMILNLYYAIPPTRIGKPTDPISPLSEKDHETIDRLTQLTTYEGYGNLVEAILNQEREDIFAF